MYRRLAAFAALPLALAACDDNTGTASVDYSATLGTLADIASTEIITTSGDATALVVALKAFDASPTATTLATAQTAWRTVRADWRKLDALYFGPTLTLGVAGRIDTGPADTAGIEAAIAGTATLDDAFVGAAGNKQKGFLGDEYLLFSAQGADAALAKLTGADGARRRQLAISMADEIASSTQQLADAWSKGSGTTQAYSTIVKTAGNGMLPYPKQLTAISDFVNGAANALDTIAMRLRANLGGGTPDPSTDPTSASDSSIADMNATLAGANAVWSQGLSTKVTSTTMVSEANSDQSDCGAKLTAIMSPYDTTLTSNTSVVQAAYTSCDAWKKKWTTDITASLGVVLSPDQDGD